MNCAEVARAYNDVVKALIRDPSVYFMLKTIPIRCVEEDPLDDGIEKRGYTNGKEIVVIASQIQSKSQLAHVLIHEALHILLDHLRRMGSRDPLLWNLATDVKINYGIIPYSIIAKAEVDALYVDDPSDVPMKGFLETRRIDPRNDSSEKIYEKLAENKEDVQRLIKPVRDLGIEAEGEYISKGSEEYNEVSIDAVSSYLKKKIAGLGQGLMYEIVVREIDAEVNIAEMLFAKIYSGVAKVQRTWRKENRRVKGLMGREYVGEKVWVLIDTSGSISDEELDMFHGVVKKLVDRGINVNLVYWDTSAVTITGRKVRRRKRMVPRYGGTLLSKPLLHIQSMFRKGRDSLIVLSDGYISDYDRAKRAYMNLRPRTSYFITTGKEVDFFDKSIKIRENKNN